MFGLVFPRRLPPDPSSRIRPCLWVEIIDAPFSEDFHLQFQRHARRNSLSRLNRFAPSRGWERAPSASTGVGVTPPRRECSHGPQRALALDAAPRVSTAPCPLLRSLLAPGAAELGGGAPSAPRWHCYQDNIYGRRGVARMLRQGGCARQPRAPKVHMRNSLTQSPSRKLALKQRARIMRHNPTTSEALLWCYLKGSKLGVGFRRQVVIGE